MNDNVVRLPTRSNHPLPDRDQRDWVTSIELVHEADISYRQLDYWLRTELLHALPDITTANHRHGDLPITPNNPGSGYLRRYAEAQVTRASTIRELLDVGISLRTIRNVIDRVLTDGHVDIGHITITHHPEEAS